MSHNIKNGLNSSLLNIKRGKGHQTFDERSNMNEETKRNKKNEVKRNSHTERRTSKKKKAKANYNSYCQRYERWYYTHDIRKESLKIET